MTAPKDRDSYPHWTLDVARYGDTDRQGHINNAAFSTYYESSRVDVMFAGEAPVAPPGSSFVIARVEIDFLAEMHWRGPVEIGAAVLSIGRSSVRFGQAIFQDGRCVSTAESVLVLMNEATRRSQAFTEEVRRRFEALMRSA